MSKYEFEKIKLNESVFYQIPKSQVANLRMNANDWANRQKEYVKLSCKQVTKCGITGEKIFLGISVTRVE